MGGSRFVKRLLSSLLAWTLGAADAGTVAAPALVAIPAGECPMGAGQSHLGDHHPKIAEFRLAVHPVTNAEYQRFVLETGHRPPGVGAAEARFQLWKGTEFPPEIARQPVVGVSWEDAVKYCQWLSKRTGMKFRLPSEEEWEYAARGGLKGKPYPAGDKQDGAAAWFGKKWNGAGTLAAADYGAANGYGLHGMSGNVWQWTATWYVPIYDGRPVAEELNLYKVIRGGAWAHTGDFLHVGYRNWAAPAVRDLYTGFRVAEGPD